MKISPSRYQELINAMAGLQKTGVPLIGYDGTMIGTVGKADDAGIYYFVPKIATIFHLTIAQSITVFFGGILAISLILGIIGCFLLFKNWMQRLVVLGGLILLAILLYILGTVYLIAPSLILAIIPLFLYLIRDQRNRFFCD